ncbi:hypothetical protein ABHI18_003984 [Aspergillus niger]
MANDFRQLGECAEEFRPEYMHHELESIHVFGAHRKQGRKR